MELLITLFLYAFVIAFDLFPIFKKGNVKTRWVYLITLLLTFGVLTLHSLNILIPSPNTLIKEIIDIFL